MGRTVSHKLVRQLRDVPDFADLDDDVLLQIVGASANLRWREDRRVFGAGEPAEALYVVLEGGVRITTADGEQVAVLGPGECFGEQSLLMRTEHRRHATTTAPTELMVIPRSGFEDLLDRHPSLAKQFRARLEERISEVR